MEVIIHQVEEFNNLPWSSLDPNQCTSHWSFGRGGYGLRDDQWSIIIFEDTNDLVEHRWAVPDQLSAVFNTLKKTTEDRVLREFRNKFKDLLGID